MNTKPNEIGGARKRLRITQQEVANRLGIPLPTYIKKERGESPFTDTQKVELAKILDWTPLQMNRFLYDGLLPINAENHW